ncbi:hypothetical protein MTO96_042027 [Rhipicephalus appendiculatus]
MRVRLRCSTGVVGTAANILMTKPETRDAKGDTDGAEYEEEVTVALEYRKMRNTKSRVPYILKLAAMPAESTACGVATETGLQGPGVSAQGSNRSPQQVPVPRLQVPIFSG